jgi:hypothetical protein
VTDYIPDTRLTESLRSLFELRDPPHDDEAWHRWYAEQSAGGTLRGRTLVTALFIRALDYWPEYFTPQDGPAVAAWAGMFEVYPRFNSSIIIRAVDMVHEQGIKEPQPYNFLCAARRITGEVL